MKGNILLNIILATVLAFDGCIHKPDVPAAVLNAFIQKYPHARHPHWDRDDGLFEVKWHGRDEHIDSAIEYTPAGKLVKSEFDLSSAQLPRKIVTYIHAQYPDAIIKECKQRIDSSGKMIYKTEMERGDLYFNEKGQVVKGKIHIPSYELPEPVAGYLKTHRQNSALHECVKKTGEGGAITYKVVYKDAAFYFNGAGSILKSKRNINAYELPQKAIAYIKSGYRSQVVSNCVMENNTVGDTTYKVAFKGARLYFDGDGHLLKSETDLLSYGLPELATSYINRYYETTEIEHCTERKDASGIITYEAVLGKTTLCFDGDGHFISSKNKDD